VGGRPEQQLVVTNVNQYKRFVTVLASVKFNPETCALEPLYVNIMYVENATGEKQLIRFLAP
jgi:hypothetical protein